MTNNVLINPKFKEVTVYGHITIGGNVIVMIDHEDGPIDLHPAKSQALRNHSPDGFSWGYSGSGPAQLALAICLEVYDTKQALAKYQDFKRTYIAPLKMDEPFTFTFIPDIDETPQD